MQQVRNRPLFGKKTGTSLTWISSFLSDRTYQLAFGGGLSATDLVQYGVPQRSVLGHTVYTMDICHVVQWHNLHLHVCRRLSGLDQCGCRECDVSSTEARFSKNLRTNLGKT